MKEIYRLRRKAVELRDCPKCGAPAGRWCRAAGGGRYDPRWTVHRSRMAADDAGLTPRQIVRDKCPYVLPTAMRGMQCPNCDCAEGKSGSPK